MMNTAEEHRKLYHAATDDLRAKGGEELSLLIDRGKME